jgi:hypothetical protein
MKVLDLLECLVLKRSADIEQCQKMFIYLSCSGLHFR